MAYTGAQVNRITQTILTAYTRDELRSAVRTGLDWDFDALVADKAFEVQVGELVRWADRDYRALDLVRCLAGQKPGNAALQALAKEMETCPHLDVTDPAYHAAGGEPSPPVQDVVLAEVGEGAAQVVVGKNNRVVQIGKLQAPFWAIGIVVASGILGLVFLGYIAYLVQNTGAVLSATPTPTLTATVTPTSTPSPTVTPTPTITPTPLPFAPAAEGETLIVIARFDNSLADSAEAHEIIRDAIAHEILDLHVPSLRVEVDENTVLEARQEPEAIDMGERFGASMVIWGADSATRTAVQFRNLRHPDMPAASVNITDMENSYKADPDAYVDLINQKLPAQLQFLALFAVGNAYYLNSDFTQARTAIQRAIAAAEATAQTPTGLADAYFRLGWLYEQPEADPASILANYNKAIALGLNTATVFNNRGVAMRNAGDLDAAIDDYKRAIDIEPDFSLPWANLGVALRETGDLLGARDALSAALRLDSNSAELHYLQGRTLYDLGDAAGAIRSYAEAIRLSPHVAVGYYQSGLAHRVLGQTDAAIEDFSAAIANAAGYADAYYERGRTYRMQGKLDAAIQDFGSALAYDPNFADASYQRGLCFSEAGQLDAAVADFTTAIRLMPLVASGYYSRGYAYYQQDELALAIQDFSQAIQLAPDYPDAYYQRAIAYYESEDLAKAAVDFAKATLLRSSGHGALFPMPPASK
jgi:tetratricopeptide (TPR) repeat protein